MSLIFVAFNKVLAADRPIREWDLGKKDSHRAQEMERIEKDKEREQKPAREPGREDRERERERDRGERERDRDRRRRSASASPSKYTKFCVAIECQLN